MVKITKDTYPANVYKMREGFHPRDKAFNIYRSTNREGYYWSCGTLTGLVSIETTLDDILTCFQNKPWLLMISETIDETSGDIIFVMHIAGRNPNGEIKIGRLVENTDYNIQNNISKSQKCYHNTVDCGLLIYKTCVFQDINY